MNRGDMMNVEFHVMILYLIMLDDIRNYKYWEEVVFMLLVDVLHFITLNFNEIVIYWNISEVATSEHYDYFWRWWNIWMELNSLSIHWNAVYVLI